MSLINIRGGHRAMAVRYIASINLLFQDEQIDMIRIEVALNELKRQRDKLLHIDDEIQNDLENEELLEDMEDAGKRLTDIQECILRTERSLRSIEQASLSVNEQVGAHINPGHSKFVKLPTLQLPFFEGNPLNWQQFWDVFRSSVHERTDLSGAQKFSYLKGQLRKDALQLLNGFATTDNHYTEAVELLTQTYGKPHKIIQAHLHALFDLETPKPTASGLTAYRAGFESHLRGLKTLGTKVDEAGFVLAALLLRKLPVKIRDNINRAQKSDCWILPTFREAVTSEISLLQSIENEEKQRSTSKDSYRAVSNNKNKASTINKSSAGSFIVPINKGCLFCHANHSHYFCDKYSTPKDKFKRILELDRCINCLFKGHWKYNCDSTHRCKRCQGKHHTLLCNNEDKTETDEKPSSRSTSASTVASSDMAVEHNGVALPTALLTLCGKYHSVQARALFDQGSQKSFILRSLTKHLNLKPVKNINLRIDEFSSSGELTNYEVVEVPVKTSDKDVLLQAVVVNKLPAQLFIPGLKNITNKLRSRIFLADAGINSDEVRDIAVLVGSDYYYEFVTGIQIYDNVHIINSKLGGMICGKLPASYFNGSLTNAVSVLKIAVEEENSMDVMLKRLWELDSIGINKDEMKKEETLVLQTFENGITYQKGRYVTELPWKPNHPNLPLNYYPTLNRLNTLLKKLRNNPIYLQLYHDIIIDQLNKEYIEIVQPSEMVHQNAKVHYIPHHGVEKDSDTTPLRIVFDCSSGSPSLNDCLFSGPVLMHELCHVLLRFRLYKFVCMTDIEKAFLQVALHEKDKDSTRFLWPRDPWDANSEIVQYRFKVVLFGATCSQFLLNATVRYHLQLNYSDISSQILRNIYVDNLHFCSNNETDLINFYNKSKDIMSEASLTLREWATNSNYLQHEIDTNKDGINKNKSIKYLGLKLNLHNDTIYFTSTSAVSIQLMTKRTVVSDSGKIFDPLGLLNPVTIKSRIFIQEMWKLGLQWDEILDENLTEKWTKILNDLQKASSIEVSREIVTHGPLIIHAFCDASNKAYGTVVYLSNHNKSSIVMSKVKVSPIKELSIPQLELTACVLAARLINYILKAYSDELKFQEIHCWTDSMVVLSWLNSKKNLKSYIYNRVYEIKQLLPTAYWHYIGTKDNIADLFTRGVSCSTLKKSEWFEGPTWLCDTDRWPETPANQFEIVEQNISCDLILCKVDSIINISKFNSLKKLYHVVVLALRFIDLLRNNSRIKCSFDNHNCSLHEIEQAEIFLLKQVQQEIYSEELDWLQKGMNMKTPNLVKQLNLFLEKGIIRCKGRLEHSELTYSAKYPILLPNKHKLSDLIIHDVHFRLGHSGVSATLNHLRQKYWIPKMRQSIKTVINHCFICKKISAINYARPIVPPLPTERVNEAKPFQICGVDFTGTIWVKENGQLIKAYICLFTCAVTRAIHLEIAKDISAQVFMNIFRRFIARRSCPQIIISDNAKNFVSTAEIIKKIQNHPEVKSLLNDHRCEWRFIPSYSRWMGGFWERLIGLTKNTLKRILGRACVTLDELQTLVVETEAILNDRPLTWVSDNLDDNSAITPSHLLYGFRLTDLPVPDEYLDTDVYNERSLLTKRQRKLATLKRQFWRRWQNEYLLSLRQFGTSNSAFVTGNQINVGDIVLVQDQNPNRLFWKMGKVLKLYEGRDKIIRSAQIKMQHGTSIRSIVHLYPLEIHDEDDDGKTIKKTNLQLPLRTMRKAAIVARKNIQSQL